MLSQVAGGLAAAGVRPHVDAAYGFDEAPRAYAELAAGDHVGKLVLTFQPA